MSVTLRYFDVRLPPGGWQWYSSKTLSWLKEGGKNCSCRWRWSWLWLVICHESWVSDWTLHSFRCYVTLTEETPVEEQRARGNLYCFTFSSETWWETFLKTDPSEDQQLLFFMTCLTRQNKTWKRLEADSLHLTFFFWTEPFWVHRRPKKSNSKGLWVGINL